MDEFSYNGETEILMPRVEVYRFSRDDEPDEPYIDYPEDGFLVFKDFIKQLKENYPNKEYPPDEVLNRMKGSGHLDYRSLTTYIAEVGNNLAGGIIGRAHGRRYEGDWYAIDPKYQKSDVTKKLLESVQRDFDEVTLLASTFGYDKDEKYGDRHVIRQQALIEYYKRLGFVVNTSSESYFPNSIQENLTTPVSMIWKKN